MSRKLKIGDHVLVKSNLVKPQYRAEGVMTRIVRKSGNWFVIRQAEHMKTRSCCNHFSADELKLIN